MKFEKPGPILGAKPTFVERAARAFSLKRALIAAIGTALTIPLYAVFKMGEAAAYISPEALMLAAIFTPIGFLFGLFTDRLPF